jgi:hypothetical protein
MEGFSMLVDIDDEGSAFTSGRLAEATHLFQQTSLRGLYRIFFVPTDGQYTNSRWRSTSTTAGRGI